MPRCYTTLWDVTELRQRIVDRLTCAVYSLAVRRLRRQPRVQRPLSLRTVRATLARIEGYALEVNPRVGERVSAGDADPLH